MTCDPLQFGLLLKPLGCISVAGQSPSKDDRLVKDLLSAHNTTSNIKPLFPSLKSISCFRLSTARNTLSKSTLVITLKHLFWLFPQLRRLGLDYMFRIVWDTNSADLIPHFFAKLLKLTISLRSLLPLPELLPYWCSNLADMQLSDCSSEFLKELTQPKHPLVFHSLQRLSLVGHFDSFTPNDFFKCPKLVQLRVMSFYTHSPGNEFVCIGNTFCTQKLQDVTVQAMEFKVIEFKNTPVLQKVSFLNITIG